MKGYFKKITRRVSRFSKENACWCSNHQGLSRYNEMNRRIMRTILKQELEAEISNIE